MAARAQVPAGSPETRLQSFAADAGLEAATQNDIDFATDGSVWVATSVGLVSFDGVNWSRYGTEQGLPSACITAVKWSDGVLWVGTDRGGGTWRQGRFQPGPAALRDVFVRRIVERVPGDLWVSTATAMLRRQGDDFIAAGEAVARDLVGLADGRLLVITADHLLRVGAEQTQQLRLPEGMSTGTCANKFAVQRDGQLLAVTHHGVRAFDRGSGWARYTSDRRIAATAAVLRIANGDIVVVNPPWTRLWRLRISLEPLSEDAGTTCGAINRMAQAPDGAVWAVGDGTLLRWQLGASTRFESPPPVCEGADGRVWFADHKTVLWQRDGTWGDEPELVAPLARRQRGDVLATWGAGGAVAIVGSQTALVPMPSASILPAQIVVDGGDLAWVLGRSADTVCVAWLDDDRRWQILDLDGIAADAVCTADPRQGVWLVERGGAPRLSHVDRGGREVWRLPEPLAGDSPAVTADGRVWIVGQSGLWVSRSPEAWQPLGTRWTRVVHWLAAVGDRLVFGCHGSPDGHGGFGIVDGTEVTNFVARSPRVVGRDRRGLYVAAENVVYLIPPSGSPAVLPVFEAGITALVIDAHEQVWSWSEGRLRHGPPPPMPHVVARSRGVVTEGQASVVAAELIYPFMPRAAAGLPTATVQWRLEPGPWSPPTPLVGTLQLPSLAAGTHHVDLLARDALGRLAAVSGVALQVARRPLEQRWWFLWAGASILALIAVLAAQAVAATRRVATQADRLREVVEKRTQKIRQELHRRARAEDRLRHQHRVLELLATGQPLAVALDALVAGIQQQLPGWRAVVSIVDGNRPDPARSGAPAASTAPPPADKAADPTASTAAAGAAGTAVAHAQPILANDGSALGVLVLVRADPATFTRDELDVVEAAAQIAAIAIDSKRGEAERQELQHQVLNAQKLRSFGLLAGGIAHDFNNLLTGILGNAGLARLSTMAGSAADNALDHVELAAQRAADLCAQLLAYSGHGRFVIKPANLSLLVQEMVQMLRLPVSRKVELELALDGSLPAVEADITQLRQVLMNLITNAAEAVGDRDGRICIRTGVAELSEARLRAAAVGQHASPGPHVFVEVGDTGRGMDEATRRSMFDPFFTTKATGRGLGLAAVLGIVRGHLGAIEIETEVGRGTRMRVFLPVTDKIVEIPLPQPIPVGPPVWGGGRILICDDEPVVLHLARTILQTVGFEIDMVADGESALHRLLDGATRYRLVVLDVVTPRLNGYEVLARVRTVHQDLPVVLSSANDIVDAGQHLLDRHTFFLKKPYGRQGLLDIVGRALGAGPPEQSMPPELSSRS